VRPLSTPRATSPSSARISRTGRPPRAQTRPPSHVRGFLQSATFFNSKLNKHVTVGQLLSELPRKQSLWDERSPLHYVAQLAHLPFPLRLYWSSHDTIVGNQGRDQTGKLYKRIKAANPSADVAQVKGLWAHSCEFVPGDCLSDALRAFELIA
jgi:hypothetical protein